MQRELRMYGFVNYQFAGTIHAGIQFGHAVVEYSLALGNSKDYKKWATKHKTFIVLNGGTTNDNPKAFGTLNTHLDTLSKYIPTASFYEPDLGDQLTAFVFIIDDRVFNRELHPDFDINIEDYDTWLNNLSSDRNEANLIVFLREYLHPRKIRLA